MLTQIPAPATGEARSIGTLLDGMAEPAIAQARLAIRELATDQERAAHQATVARLMRARRCGRDGKAGEILRARILKVLGQFRDHGTVTLGPGKKTWQRLHQLVRMCAAAEDWAGPVGPIVGASNAVLEQLLATQNVRREFRLMARWGLIVPHCPKGNGHRFYRPARGRQYADGSGWSLAPLLLLVDQLEHAAREERAIRELRVELPDTIKRSLYACRSLLKPFADDAPWAQRLLAEALRLSDRRRAARAIDDLRAVADDAEALLRSVENHLAKAVPPAPIEEELSTRPDTSVRRQYNEKQSDSCNEGSAGARSERSGTTSPHGASGETRPNEPEPDTDPYGVRRSGFVLRETPILFPFIDGLAAVPSAPEPQLLFELARLTGVEAATAGRAARLLGLLPALLCLLITGQHSADGEIHATPEIYMRGLIKRALEGYLNIGHTIFGRRKALTDGKAGGAA